jgi:ATP/maltotriose-dependent transcriptional regulator MalT
MPPIGCDGRRSAAGDEVPCAVEEELIVVLDHYHLIDSPEVHESARFVLEHPPPRVHLVLASRADPPIAAIA